MPPLSSLLGPRGLWKRPMLAALAWKEQVTAHPNDSLPGAGCLAGFTAPKGLGLQVAAGGHGVAQVRRCWASDAPSLPSPVQGACGDVPADGCWCPELSPRAAGCGGCTVGGPGRGWAVHTAQRICSLWSLTVLSREDLMDRQLDPSQGTLVALQQGTVSTPVLPLPSRHPRR